VSDLKIENFKFSYEAVSRLSLLQVEPTALDFDRDDSEHRGAVFNGIVEWLTAKVSPPTFGIRSGQLDETAADLETLPRPQIPRIVSFPELYTPYEVVLDLSERGGLEGEQVIMTGLSTSQKQTIAAPFFDSATLKRLLAHPAAGRIKNLDYVKGLQTRLSAHGMCANLAASLILDRYAKRHLVIHSKVIPSKYEQRHRYEKNTIEGSELQTIDLHWNSDSAHFVLLPLICSDFAYRHEALRHSVLHKLAHDAVNVDLLCVMSVQKCFTDGHPPWPREYQLPTLEVAEQRFTTGLDRTHTMMTNVGSYTLDTKPYPAGFSFLSLQNGHPWSPHESPQLWDGTIWYFGKLEPTTTSSLPHTYAWACAREGALRPTGNLTKHIAGLLTHERVDAVDAVLQHFEISVGRIGQEAWQSGRLIAFRLGRPLEQL